ncbi:NeuD/PglB/VioB family sugar acetyltransferase [Algibacter miyuki]|uniref:NeuD/PglB/VioB family sugar acetyltransferase n=1 Tax=Algibacter miyuki TaxID=1306933 RepID=A0ABV5GYE0_9FLAO|nr:NeuD/PglB/VioB family sugar acetyltransferase [Algibacter miyuki]MDN3667140.1 NeuD/PglB/VioB family sugar acetyltransferase [Algibacter miyuki]
MAKSELEKQNIIIIGASGHASVIIDIIERQNIYTIVGLIDSYKPLGTTLFDYEVLGNEQILPQLIKSHHVIGGIIAIGDNYSRRVMFNKIQGTVPDFNFVTAIHPNATIGKSVQIGKGTVIMPGAIANANAVISDFCILNTASTLGHDSKMDHFSSLAPGVNIAGNVTIKTSSSIGIGSCIIGGISIGSHTHIGAGSTVIKSIADFKLAYGNPAIEMRSRQVDENHLGLKSKNDMR